MAEEEGMELPIPLNGGERDDVAIPIEPVVLEEVRVRRELYEDRYQLEATTFTGEDEVEQFIQEFQEVMEIAQWPPRVALLKLRMALRDKAKRYGTGPDIDGIFASLQGPFWYLRHRCAGPSTETAAWSSHDTTRARYHGDKAGADRVPPQVNRERYIYDAFVQSINNLGLHHQFVAKGVTTVKSALAVGEVYNLASHMHRNHLASRQVDTGHSAAPSIQNAETPAVANVTQMTLASKVDHVTDMLVKLVAALVPPNPIDNTREPSGPRAQSPGTGRPFCWGCGRLGHFQKSCPQLQPGLNYDGPQMLLPPAGRRWIPKGGPSGGRHAGHHPATSRPPTRRVGGLCHSPPGFSVSPRDGVDNLWTTKTAREATRAPRHVPLHPPQLVHGRQNSPIPGLGRCSHGRYGCGPMEAAFSYQDI